MSAENSWLKVCFCFKGWLKWQSTPVFLPAESHGGRSLVGYSPWGRKESDTSERLHFLSLSLMVNITKINFQIYIFPGETRSINMR